MFRHLLKAFHLVPRLHSARARAKALFLGKVSPLLGLMELYFGYEVVGIHNIPVDGPSLIVMNHGVLPFHAFMLSKEILFQLGVLPRALVADFLVQTPGVDRIFFKGGAVQASRENAERLLKAGYPVLVAPGGIHEALLMRPGAHEIPWHTHHGYAEVACQLKVPIVPSYCVGINEAYFNSRLFLKERMKYLEQHRFSMPLFFGIGIFPFPVKLTHYIGQPIPTGLKKGEKKEQAVDRLHHEVVAAMRQLMKNDHPRR